VSEINAFLASAALALVVCLVISALQFAGVISVTVARLCLFAAWVIAVIGVCGSLQNAPSKHLVIAAVATGAPLGLALIGLERWISRKASSEPTKPKLKGEIICADINPNLTAKFSDTVYDCFLIVTLKVHGENAVPTMVSRWELDLLWEGIEHPGTRENLEGYCYKRDYAHPAEGKTNFETQWIPLKEFPNDEEITNTNYKVGSVRFSVRSFPLSGVENGRLRKSVTLRLQALDNTGYPHLIYEDTTWGLSGCGEIEKDPDNKFLFA
jgi:hypothetical protein